jgi:Rod binding domain-containing protein
MGTSIGFGSLAAQANAVQSNEDSMVQDFRSSNRPTDASKIDKGAKEFEAVLVGSWLQQAEQSFATVPGADEDEQDVGRGSMMSLGVQTLATSMAATGGIGIGKMVAKAMHAAADKVAGQSADTNSDNIQPSEPSEGKNLARTNEKRAALD